MTKLEPSLTWITVADALVFARKSLKSSELGKIYLKSGLAGGSIAAKTRVILEEYALGTVRTFSNRRTQYEIKLIESGDSHTLSIDPQKLVTRPRGARLLFNWTASRITWVAPPPTKTFVKKSTGSRGVLLGTRTVMYDITLNRKEVESFIASKVKNAKTSATLSSLPPRTYNFISKYRKMLPDIFALADVGELDPVYGPFDEYGKKAKFKIIVNARCGNILKRGTLQRVSAEILAINAAAHSQNIARQQIDQQLTNQN